MKKLINLITNLGKWVRQQLSMLLFCLSLTAFVAAGFLFGHVAGLIVLGIALMVLAWVTQPRGGDVR